MKMNCHSGGRSRQGIALVITLIMLSVTLVMAIAFLALARRERNSVSTTTDTTTAKLAADSALAAAQAQIMGNILSTANFRSTNNGLYNYGLLVSTNYFNSYGFAEGSASPTNVNFFHYGQPPLTTIPYLNQADFMQNVANLQFLPRVPVFIQTPAGTNDFRFYLDLNRNGAFDDSGSDVSYVEPDGTTNRVTSAVGDPQWVGVLARPDAVHAADNQFVSRYAFIAVPIGNGLDINAIHNQAVNTGLRVNNDGFFRNEGVGSWELNLAAFLADLNTNAWDPQTTENPANNPYFYGRSGVNPNSGRAFEDAYSILVNRYAGSYSSLAIPGNYTALVRNSIDFYTVGPLMTTPFLRPNNFPPNSSWVGSDNTNHFYDLPSELYNPAESSANFVADLTSANNGFGRANPSTYDRYTYYRLLSQMGTDSDPDDGKMNLNFKNIVNGTVVPGMETNAIRWTALDFFTNAADRMLRMYSTNWFCSGPTNYLATYYFITNRLSATIQNYYYFDGAGNKITNSPIGFGLTNVSLSSFLGWTNVVPGFGITNIPVYVNGQFVYSPAVNRVLQLAANMYEASTNAFYPHIFRPLFVKDQFTNIFIVGFTNLSDIVVGTSDRQLAVPYTVEQLKLPIFPFKTPLIDPVGGSFVNVYGVPWIIGAKKGFPSFNKFGMQTVVQVTRKLQVKRSTVPTVLNSTTPTTFLTNQLLAFSVSNYVNSDCWNSYSNRLESPVQIYAQDTMSMVLTNSYNTPPSFFYNHQIFNNTLMPSWPGYTNAYPTMSFTNPLSGVVVLLTNSDFYFGTSPPGQLGFQPDSLYGWESNLYTFQFPQFVLTTTNQFQLYMLNQSNGLYHVIDYVQFSGPQPVVNLTQAIEGSNPSAVDYGLNMWSQSLNRGVPYGILSQMTASDSPISANGGNYWANSSAAQVQIDGFAKFMGLTMPYPDQANQNNPSFEYYATNYVVQVPFTPTATVSMYTSWQANDPLVHYLASDLNFSGVEVASGLQTGVQATYGRISDTVKYPSFSFVNERYQPWGIQYVTGLTTNGPNGVVSGPYSLDIKDPLIWGSDYWSFPTNLYPTIGWIGRVHRGTPWQTVYLKADDVLHVLQSTNYPSQGSNTWANWTENGNLADLANSVPVQDRKLFDLFTARPNDNAALGTLSVNQTNLAAWSAVFSGMVALTNIADFKSLSVVPPATSNSWTTIQPAAVSPQLQTLVNNINFARSGTNLLFGFTNADGVVGSFEHAGDILAAPALTEQSPFLNWTNLDVNINAALKAYGINDATYEWLPQQMMGLVRDSSTPRYVIYAYGQALRPAPGGVVTGSTDFGLVTNYQVVAESAVRAIVSVHAQVDTSGSYPVTNYTTRVESYSVLPPD